MYYEGIDAFPEEKKDSKRLMRIFDNNSHDDMRVNDKIVNTNSMENRNTELLYEGNVNAFFNYMWGCSKKDKYFKDNCNEAISIDHVVVNDEPVPIDNTNENSMYERGIITFSSNMTDDPKIMEQLDGTSYKKMDIILRILNQ